MFIRFYKSPPPVSTALGFEKCVSPLSTCSIEVESTSHFFFCTTVIVMNQDFHLSLIWEK